MATAAPHAELTIGRPIESGGAFIVCVKDAIGLSIATFYGSSPDQALQRARQFEAAPAILDALLELRPYFEGEHAHDHPSCIQMRDAIAKSSR